MSLRQHLVELRKRLFRSAAAILLFSVGGFFVGNFVLDGLRQPIIDASKEHGVKTLLNYSGATAAFDLHLQIAFFVGIIVASPIWLYQLFAFLVPGLTKREKKYTFGFFFSTVPLFLAGCTAGWLVLPHMFLLLNSFVSSQDANFLDAKDYFTFAVKLILAVGIAFILPVFLVLLNFMGILTGKAILKAWRWAILVIIVFCAIATPSADVISMFLLAAPIIGLYFIAVGIAFVHDRAALKRAQALENELDTASL